MTFRIDGAGVRKLPEGWRLEAQFKGYQGRGVYGEASLESGSGRMLVWSTMNISDCIDVPVTAPPVGSARTHIDRWFAGVLDELGWGPEVDQRGRLMNRHAARADDQETCARPSHSTDLPSSE